jgi:putative peptide zinc metalloprotease protein
MVQLPGPLYVLVEEIDGERSYEQLAGRLSERIGRSIGPGDVQTLVEERLRPLGVLAQPDGSSPQLPKADPLLALRFRVALVPEAAVQVISRLFTPLFMPPVLVAMLGAFVVADVWLFASHGVAQSVRELLYKPLWMLAVLGIIVVNTAWHELGHASALRYGGGRPGSLGAGIYIVWPAFYTDVTDAYRLSRGGRIRTDLGGLYFNAIFVLGVLGAYLLTGIEPLLIAILVIHLQMLQQFMPFLRLDGYYLVSDLTGVPDLFARIKPTLKSALPGTDEDAKADALKPWVRSVTTGWVLLVIPVIVLVFGLLVFNAPRMFATGWDSFWVQADRVDRALAQGSAVTAGAGALQALFLLLPAAGWTYTFSKVGLRVSSGAWSWSAESPVRRAGIGALLGLMIASGGYVLVPNGDYAPIQSAERGTIQGGIREFASVHTGRPSFTRQRARELGEIVRERDRARSERQGVKTPTGKGRGRAVISPDANSETTGLTDTIDTATTDETLTETVPEETAPLVDPTDASTPTETDTAPLDTTPVTDTTVTDPTVTDPTLTDTVTAETAVTP